MRNSSYKIVLNKKWASLFVAAPAKIEYSREKEGYETFFNH